MHINPKKQNKGGLHSLPEFSSMGIIVVMAERFPRIYWKRPNPVAIAGPRRPLRCPVKLVWKQVSRILNKQLLVRWELPSKALVNMK